MMTQRSPFPPLCVRGLTNARTIVLCGLLSITALVGEASIDDQAPHTPDPDRGRSIYTTGKPDDGPSIKALIGRNTPPLPATAFPCANCHGEFGQGTNEGGLQPPSITWQKLTRNHKSVFTQRERPAYDESTLLRAIQSGIDATGKQLHPGMPRYQMTDRQARDLVTYLQTLGKRNQLDRGVFEEAVRIGAALPLTGHRAETGAALQHALERYFQLINESGGVFGRRLDLVIRDSGINDHDRLNALHQLVEEDKVFALVGCYPWSSDPAAIDFLTRTRTLVIGPLGVPPVEPNSGRSPVFYTLTSLEDQCRVMIDRIASLTEPSKATIAVVYANQPKMDQMLRHIRTQARLHNLPKPIALPLSPENNEVHDLILKLTRAHADWILYLGNASALPNFAEELVRVLPEVRLLCTSSVLAAVATRLPQEIVARSEASFAAPLPDPIWMESIMQDQDDPKQFLHHAGLMWLEEGAARVLVEGLKRSGRRLSREVLMQSLESMHEVHIPMFTPLTYGLNRRCGATATYLGSFDVERQRFRVQSTPQRPRAQSFSPAGKEMP